MGYLIKQTIKKVKVRIPQADVLTLDTIPYVIIPFSNNNNYTVLAANLQVDNVSGNLINSFGHFYLFYKPAPSPKFAIYDEISFGQNIIEADITSNFILNMSHPPNVFGSRTNKTIFPLSITSELPPSANCDLIVTVYYFNNF
jgi:hypothetical protein